MPRFIRITLIVLCLLAMASALSLFTYGRFAESAMGEPGHAIAPPTAEQVARNPASATPVDRVMMPLTEAHPGKTGMSLITGNTDAFTVRALSASHAGRSLDLQYYLWHDDLTGRLLAAQALAAADRGVRVRVLIDDINAHGADAAFRSLDKHPGIEVRMFNPSRNRGGSVGRAVEILLRGMSLNKRMHNKAWIVDGQIAVVGGRNIGNEYFDAAQDTNFLDADVLLAGPAVAQTAAIFDDFWNSRAVIPISALADDTDLSLDAVREVLRGIESTAVARPYLEHVKNARRVNALLTGQVALHWDANARVVSDPAAKVLRGEKTDPDTWLIAPIMRETRSAQRDLTIISPYFVPGEEGTRELTELAKSGVSVSILTNSLASNDVMAVHSGYASYRKPLLEGGVKLFELMPFGDTNNSLFGSSGASLHTKAFTVDGRRGFIGSFNFDPRSVQLNTEMGLLFDHPDLAAELMAQYREHAGPEKSYALSLERGDLRWEERRTQPSKIWRTEPETSIWSRLIVELLGWLPLESQL